MMADIVAVTTEQIPGATSQISVQTSSKHISPHNSSAATTQPLKVTANWLLYHDASSGI